MNELLECARAPRFGIRVAFLLSPEHKADEKEGAMVQILTFAREWSKWYRVLRQRKGF
jgi:hypothetical protein